jgi:hypothetical protein
MRSASAAGRPGGSFQTFTSVSPAKLTLPSSGWTAVGTMLAAWFE